MAGRSISTRSIQVREMDIPDVFLITTERFGDERGLFYESYREDVLSEVLDHPLRIVQANYSVSHRNVLRGIHGAAVPPGQAKIVSCLRGTALDFSIDLRVGSPTFGRYEMVVLDQHSCASVYLGEGMGHAFLALTDDTCMHYQCSTTYVPQDVITVHPLDPEIRLPFRLPEAAILSPTDTAAPTLAEAAERGLLPSYEDCVTYHAKLRANG
jgi:dTDP-4-dehydrorhamnose 3,5-epimerase